MTTKCVFDGSVKALDEKLLDLLCDNFFELCEAKNKDDLVCISQKITTKFVHDNFKEKKSHVPKCSECGATCWSNNRTRGSKRICRKCYNKTKEENENVEEK